MERQAILEELDKFLKAEPVSNGKIIVCLENSNTL